MSEQSKRGGVTLVLVATFGLALKGIWARLAYAEGLDVGGVMFYRAALAAPLTLILAKVLRSRLEQRREQADKPQALPGDIWKAAALGAFFSLGMWSDFQAIAYLGAGVSRVILFGFPLGVLIIEASVSRIWPRRHRLLGFFVAWLGLLGVALGGSVASPVGNSPSVGSGSSGLPAVGLFWALVSLVLYAIFVWCSGRLAPRLGSVRMTTVTQLATAAVVLPVGLVVGGGEAPSITGPALGWILLMVGISTIGPYFLLTEGIARLGAAPASLLAMFGPTVTLLVSALVLDERLSALQWVGTIATLGGVKLSQAKGLPSLSAFRLTGRRGT